MSKVQAIFIEAGHGSNIFGGKDVGAVGKLDGVKIYERDFAVRIAKEVLNILRGKEELGGCLVQGVGVETLANPRKKMAYVNSVIKENYFNSNNCYGIAIHMNASVSKTANGFEVWYQKSGKSLPFANAIASAWHKYAVNKLRPKPVNSSAKGRYGRFYIDDTLSKYIIIETGFISNEEDARVINNSISRVAEALAHGILTHIRESYKVA